MSNTLKMEKREILIGLFESGWSTRKINKATGIHRKTISSYRRAWQAGTESEGSGDTVRRGKTESSTESHSPGQSVPPEARIKCPPGKVVHFEVSTDPQKATINSSRSSASWRTVHDSVIRRKLEKGQNARSIYQDLYVEEDYRGSYDSVKRYVRKLKKASPKLYARLETLPGEEAQVDFGEGAPTLNNGRYLKPWLFVMTLSYSRKSYEEVIWSSASWRTFSQHMGFVPLPCKVGTPEHKGKVEAGIKYVQNNALKGKRFSSLQEQNRYLRDWNKTWATTRIHGTTKRQVRQMFCEEEPALKPLPEKAFVFFKIGTRKVNTLDSHIEVGGAYYPVPPEYMGKGVDVHFNSQWVKVFYQGRLIQWLSTIDKGRFHPDPPAGGPEDKRLNGNAWREHLLERCTPLGSSVRNWARQLAGPGKRVVCLPGYPGGGLLEKKVFSSPAQSSL